jgi:hypothetical protein
MAKKQHTEEQIISALKQCAKAFHFHDLFKFELHAQSSTF